MKLAGILRFELGYQVRRHPECAAVARGAGGRAARICSPGVNPDVIGPFRAAALKIEGFLQWR